MHNDVLKIYTDGACSGNPGPGGWGVVMIFAEHIKELSGAEQDTTNNRMELLAVIRGLEAVTKKIAVEIYSDSSYIVNAINQGWLENWQRSGWKTANKDSVKNQDLWQKLIELNKEYKPKYIKVKGHSTDKYNNRADELAVGAIKR
ncbi:MAG: ribonuclease HI [Firmicutes bacterium]|nr:ribonuclease HI [Bacillota bacterium]